MMHFQLWDRDLLRLELISTRVVGIVSPSYSRVGTSYNDCIAESVLDLSAAFRIACVPRQSSGALLTLPCLRPWVVVIQIRHQDELPAVPISQ